MDLAVEILRNIGDVLFQASNNQTFASLVGGVAGGIVAPTLGWFARHKSNIKHAEVNEQWHVWDLIHRRINENLNEWVLSSVSQAGNSIRIEFVKKDGKESKIIQDEVYGHDLLIDDKPIKSRKEQRIRGYCVRCKAKRLMVGIHKVRMKNGRSAVSGSCAKCGTKMFKIGKLSSTTKSKATSPSFEATTSLESAKEKLLYSQGETLEFAVYTALKTLGIEMEPVPDGTGDGIIRFGSNKDYKIGLVNIKSSSELISVQALKVAPEMAEDLGVDFGNVKGIIITNQYNKEPYPESRYKRIRLTDTQSDYCRREHICVIPTCVLFDALNAKQRISPRRLLQFILKTNGVLDFIDEKGVLS